MSIAAYLVCPSRRLCLLLGKRLRDEEGPFGFSVGRSMSSEIPELGAAVWAFLADTAGEQVRVAFSDDPDFDDIAAYTQIEIDPDGCEGEVDAAEYVRRFTRRAEEARRRSDERRSGGSRTSGQRPAP